MSKSTRIKHTMQGTAPPPRNYVAASLSAFRPQVVKAKRGRGSYKRDKTVED